MPIKTYDPRSIRCSFTHPDGTVTPIFGFASGAVSVGYRVIGEDADRRRARRMRRKKRRGY